MEKQEKTVLYGLSLIVSLVGAILLLATDFSGFWNGVYYGYIDLESDAVSGLVITSLFLFYCAIVNLLFIINPDKRPDERFVKLARLLSLLAFIICTIGGIAFAIAMGIDDVWEWWFGAGFYGGIIGSLLTFIFMYIAEKK